MDWGNVIVEKIEWNADRSFIGLLEVKLNLDGDFKKTKKKLTWLARGFAANQEAQHPVSLVLKDYDYLITKKKLEEDDDVKDFVTKVSEFQYEAWGDANLRTCKKGDIIQLERKGYYIVDKEFNPATPTEPIEVISIPDGSVSSTVSKNAATDAKPAADAGKSKKEGDSKAAKEKAPKGKAAAVPTTSKINMYEAKEVYGSLPVIKNASVSKMYEAKKVYGDLKPIKPEAAVSRFAPL
jgi:glutamyl-tRNA synthetase